jgi:hypothetical protein
MVALATLGEITVRKLLLTILSLAAAALAGQAQAQQVRLPANTERMTLTNLRHYMLGDDGKSVSPHSSVQDDEEAPFWIDADGRMLGNPYTMGCVKMWRTGEGRMTYNLKGGRLQHAASCENIGVTDYEWSTSVSFSPGRIILNGEARTVGPCLASDPNCERPRMVATEKAVIRIEGKKCFVESYNFKTSETSSNPYLKGNITSFVTFSTPKSRCSFLE